MDNVSRGGSSQDNELTLLVGAAQKVDFVAAQESAASKTFDLLKSLALENAEANQRREEITAIEQRITKLFQEQEIRSRALLRVIEEQGENGARKVLQDIERLRTFFFVINNGWKKARWIYGRWYVDQLMRHIRMACPEEVTSYKQARRDWREARKRYLATDTERDWHWYTRGKGNRNSVAYRTKVDLSRRGGEAYFRKRRLMKYMAHELLSRKDECRRAKKELRVAQAAMAKARQSIYKRMGIPLDLV